MATNRSVDPAAVDESFLAHLRLACVPGVGGVLRQRLLARFGSPQAVFAASSAELATVHQVGPKLAQLIPELAASPVAEQLEILDILGIDDVEHLVGRLADLGIHTRPRSMMAFHRLVSSRSCFFHRGSQAASWFQKRSEWSM